MHRDATADRPTSIDRQPAATHELPRPLAVQERSRLEATTWNWDAVKVYPGGQGLGVSFTEYARGEDATDGAVPPFPSR